MRQHRATSVAVCCRAARLELLCTTIALPLGRDASRPLAPFPPRRSFLLLLHRRHACLRLPTPSPWQQRPSLGRRRPPRQPQRPPPPPVSRGGRPRSPPRQALPKASRRPPASGPPRPRGRPPPARRRSSPRSSAHLPAPHSRRISHRRAARRPPRRPADPRRVRRCVAAPAVRRRTARVESALEQAARGGRLLTESIRRPHRGARTIKFRI